jgi:mono/diheme cytochrome c family protein
MDLNPEGVLSHSVSGCMLSVTLLISASALYAADPSTEFKQRCAQCHGPDARGNTTIGKSLKIPDLSGAEAGKRSDAELTQVISEGRGSMPGFKATLDAPSIKQLVGYIRSLQKTARK